MSAISVRPAAAAASDFAVFRADQSRKLQKMGQRLGICWEFRCRGKRFAHWAIGRRNQITVMRSKREEGVHAFRKESLVDDPLTFESADGIEATLNNMSKWLISVVTAVIILWRHDPEALWAASGAVLNSTLSMGLKKLLNQERPISTLRSDPGMPSSHAQTVFYTVMFLNLSLVEWYGMNVVTTILCGILSMVGSYVSWLRVSQQLHTLNQVIVGAVVGSIFSSFWMWLWYTFVLDSFTSFLWVKTVVVLGTAVFCFSFLNYLIQLWFGDEQ